MKRTSPSAFTLVEVLTGIVVFATISACTAVAVGTLFRGEQLSRARNIAINLMQKSQEEIRKAALTFYDPPQGPLEDCQFPGPNFGNTNRACGLKALDASFTGYTRSVTIAPESGSSELKKAIITVNWTDLGQPKSIQSAVLLAHPPDALPGNVVGIVKSTANGNPLLPNVQIRLFRVGGKDFQLNSAAAISKSENNEDINFNFKATTGAYQVDPGTWNLTANLDHYESYTHPQPIVVSSSLESRRIEIFLRPLPDDAHLQIRMINALTNQPLGDFHQGRSYVLDDYEPTKQVHDWRENQTSWDTTIHFSNTNPQQLTVMTLWAYRAGYAQRPSCSGLAYEPDGWSSSRYLQNGAINCNNPYNGNAASDRIVVNPGDSFPVIIPLYPVPEATVSGTVKDQNGQVLEGAKVFAKWPRRDSDATFGNAWWWKNGYYPFAVTDRNGNFTLNVPAVQELFESTPQNYLELIAQKKMPSQDCCNTISQVDRQSNLVNVGRALKEGDLATGILLIIPNGGTYNCGNVQGQMRNGETGALVSNALIILSGSANTTDGGGYYIYQCPGVGFQLPEGLADFHSSKNAYYPFDQSGNEFYTPQPAVNIKANQLVNYNAKMWPVGVGRVIVHVTKKGSGGGTPIKGASVKFNPYNAGPSVTMTTGNDGQAVFDGVVETWPPPGVIGDNYYKQTPRSHSIDITHPSYEPDHGEILNLEKGQTITIEIELTGHGAA